MLYKAVSGSAWTHIPRLLKAERGLYWSRLHERVPSRDGICRWAHG